MRSLEDTQTPVDVFAFQEFVAPEPGASYILLNRLAIDDDAIFEQDAEEEYEYDDDDDNEYVDEASYLFAEDEDEFADEDEEDPTAVLAA